MLRMLRGLLTRRVAVATAAVVAPVAVAKSNFVHSEAPAPALSPEEFRKFKLIKAEQLTADTKRYTFQLPREHDELGLTVASCLSLQIDVDGALTDPRIMRLADFTRHCKRLNHLRTSVVSPPLHCIVIRRQAGVSSIHSNFACKPAWHLRADC